MQTGQAVYALVNATPRPASRSRLGVLMMGIAQRADGIEALLVHENVQNVGPHGHTSRIPRFAAPGALFPIVTQLRARAQGKLPG